MNSMLSFGEANFNSLYRNYKRYAENKHREFTLSKTDFKRLTQSNCYYCGQGPSQKHNSNIKRNGYYLYNGVDRMNNDIGYTMENCVPCCGKCNMMKRSMNAENFIEIASKSLKP